MPHGLGLILAVDDNEAHNYSVMRWLASAGYHVRQAHSGAQALERVKTKPKLVILDVNMPDMNGFEVCRRLKADPTTRDIPVVFLSATYDAVKGKAMAREAGALSFLAAPIRPEALVQAVDSILGQAR